MSVRILTGDCRTVLATFEADSIDACVADPPYGLSREPDVVEVLTHWLAGDDYHHSGGGFMGRSWDSFVPGPSYWRAVYRVMKPGGYVLAFGGTRTSDLLTMALRLARFEIRDCLLWLHAQGFPKNLNVSKALDKAAGVEREVVGVAADYARDGATRKTDGSHVKPTNQVPNGDRWAQPITTPATDLARQWEGWGTALKPSYEPIILARKPLAGTVAATVSQFGTGALNIDGCRIPVSPPSVPQWQSAGSNNNWAADGRNGQMSDPHNLGRWPSNVILSHHPSCVERGTKRVKGASQSPQELGRRPGGFANVGHAKGDSHPNAPGYADDDGMETVSAWDCHPECPVAMLDAQSGESQSRIGKPRGSAEPGNGWGMTKTGAEYDDAGGPSRFFRVFYTAKSSRAERNRGLEGMPERVSNKLDQRRAEYREDRQTEPIPVANHHPTVKPLDLMQWLIRLITPPGGVVLDCFAGSGSTGVAADREGFDAILIEQDPEYAEIARRRIIGDAPLFATVELTP